MVFLSLTFMNSLQWSPMNHFMFNNMFLPTDVVVVVVVAMVLSLGPTPPNTFYIIMNVDH